MPTMTFDRLIAPVERDRFLREFWTRKAVHLEDAGRAFDDVFGWEALNAVLSARDLTFPKIKVSRNDQPVPPEKFTTDGLVDVQTVLALFREGASVGITGADSDWPPLRAVVEAVYDALLESVHTNVYLSPPNTQGFQCHFDLHEVFVLQVEGTKHWRVFAPTIEPPPVESWRPQDAPGTDAKPYIDVVLRKGDVLYVPRGHWHYAVAQESTSIHVTVGVTCHKGAAFLDWFAREAASDPIWRKNMPPVNGAVSDGAFALPAEWSAWVEALTRSLSDTLADPDLAEKFCKTMLRSVRPIGGVEVELQTAGVMDIEALVFERPMGRRHFFLEDDESVTLTSADCDIELEAADAGFLAKIFSVDTFTADDIRRWRPDADLPEVAELLGELVRTGLLIARPR
jgi:ribosomal protein L16 Arg81 hydroxylase